MGKAKWFSVMLGISLLLLNSSQLVFADDLETPQDGNNSPAACLGGPTDNWTGAETDNMYDAGLGDIVTGICIKSGNDSFGALKHSGLLAADGTFGDGNVANSCYMVSGIGTQTVTVEETGASGCKDVSHVDFFTELDGGGPPSGTVGGMLIPIDTAALLLANAQSSSWMIPVVVSIVGIGLFVVSRKTG